MTRDTPGGMNKQMQLLSKPFSKLGSCILIGAALCGATGCAHLQQQDTPDTAQKMAVVEKEEAPPLSSAERSQRFREAYSQGLKWVQAGEYGVALGAFEEAVEMDPSSIEALFNLGACHDAIGDPLKAIPIYRRILDLTPNDADCYANLGTSYIKLYHQEKSPGWKNMARQNWERSLELNPRQANIRNYLAQFDSAD